MGGPYTIDTGHPLIKGDDWGRWLRFQYGDKAWPSYSVMKWFFEAV